MTDTITRKQFEEWLDGACTEIGAGSVMFVKDDADRAWNQANERAKRIVKSYKEGHGLFQLPEAVEEAQPK